MIRRLFIAILISAFANCFSAFAKEKTYYLDYYSFGDPLQLALDYAFSSVGYRFTAHPDLLSRPWFGQFKGSVTASTLPSYVESVLSPLGLRVDLGAESVYIVHQAEPTGVFRYVDTTIALDSSVYEYVSAWCSPPVCSSIRLPSGYVWIRSLPDYFESLVRPLSGFLEPVALDPADDLEAVFGSHAVESRPRDFPAPVAVDFPPREIEDERFFFHRIYLIFPACGVKNQPSRREFPDD